LDQTFQVFGDREPMLLEEVTVTAGNPFIGKMLKDTHIKSLTEVMILGIKQQAGDFQLNPSSNYIIALGDTLIGLGRPTHFQKLRNVMGM
jgi:K+/H+ antiporter YhaU regulatory subunit KhtT